MRFCLVALLALWVPAAALAAPGDDQNPPGTSQSPPRPAPDFLFGAPRGWVGFRGGWMMPRAGSDWYRFVTRQLTVDDKDFNAPTFGTDVGITLTPRLDLVISFDFSQASVGSEYRDFVDNNRLPITQETRLREINLGGGVRYSLTERGRQVSRFAWVPRTAVPYVGAGGGTLYFDMRQVGDFVDFVDFSVFNDVFEAKGWAPSAFVFGGVDLRVYRRLYVNVDGRYLWAAGDLGPDWIDFEKIDLAGFRLGAGVSFLF